MSQLARWVVCDAMGLHPPSVSKDARRGGGGVHALWADRGPGTEGTGTYPHRWWARASLRPFLRHPPDSQPSLLYITASCSFTTQSSHSTISRTFPTNPSFQDPVSPLQAFPPWVQPFPASEIQSLLAMLPTLCSSLPIGHGDAERHRVFQQRVCQGPGQY